MAIQVSPGIQVNEVDLTASTPAVSTSIGALAGVFNWGPANTPIQISTEQNLNTTFGTPDANTSSSFFTASSFLSYGGNSQIVRALLNGAYNASTGANVVNSVTTTAGSAVVTTTASVASIQQGMVAVGPGIPPQTTVLTVTPGSPNSITLSENAFASGTVIASFQGTVVIPNEQAYFSNTSPNGYGSSGNIYNAFTARYPGALGNSLQVVVWPSAAAFNANGNPTFSVSPGTLYAANGSAVINGTTVTTVNLNTATFQASTTNNAYVGGVLKVVSGIGSAGAINSAAIIAYDPVTYIATLNTALSLALTTGSSIGVNSIPDPLYQFQHLFPYAPGTSAYAYNVTGNSNVNDEIHIAVVDTTGLISGYANTVLETYTSLSVLADGTNVDGSSSYYKEVLYRKSNWILWSGHPTSNTVGWGALTTTPGLVIGKDNVANNRIFNGGFDGTITNGVIETALDNFNNPENIDISLLMTADADPVVQAYAINLAAARKDCMAFVSPSLSVTQDPQSPSTAISNYFTSTLNSYSSYAFADSGWKYMYDKYNDVYRWVPLNGDMAGLCAYTDTIKAPWWSPAGLQRGVVKNVVKLAFNPNQAARDTLYKAGVNPVVSFPGEGTVLYGDKTMQNRPSAFDRINVRRLFIVLEKTISAAAKQSLFEFNDDFTRAQFIALVDPFLRTVQAQRGIYAYKVVCDSTNNTPAVVDANQFVGDIYIQPARSINFITLNFVAVRTGVSFDEVVGKF
jgi:hypothetical protein